MSTKDASIKPERKKVLLMGKSGSGKSSMRSIIFSNYVAKDVRRLGATIDVEHSTIKFLGNLVLNLWDCGGQDAFTETYLTTQRAHVFSSVGVLIYVFDVTSRSFEGPDPRDLATYSAILSGLAEYSPDAHIFCLLHKMDLVQSARRDEVIANRSLAIKKRSEAFAGRTQAYATSIWDQTLYGAWGSIVNALIPDLDVMENALRSLRDATGAEEVVLFERATFLTVLSVVGEVGAKNPYVDRQEKLSNVIKTFKHTLSNYTNTPSTSNPFSEIVIKTGKFSIIISRLTANTYVLVVLPPGEMDLQCARFNIMAIRSTLMTTDDRSANGQALNRS